MPYLTSFLLLLTTCSVLARNVPEYLTLPDALALTLIKNPELQVYHWDIRIAEAEAVQARVIANPELSLEVEDGLGSGDYQGFDVAQSTLSLSQSVELGSQRLKRMRMAAAGTALARQDYLLKRARILNALAKAYLNVLQAQQEVVFARDLLNMQRELLAAQEDRIQAGRAAEAERETAVSAVVLSEIESREAEHQLSAARLALAGFWASESPRFRSVGGDLELPPTLPGLASLKIQLKDNPILDYHHLLLVKHQAALALERASRFSDVNLGVGTRRFEDSNDHAFTLSVSIALPLFDRNQGNIHKAHAELEKTKAERTQVLANLSNALSAAHQELLSTHEETQILATQVVPIANKGYDLMRESFRLGQANYLEMRQAQATLIEARRKLYAAQIRYHKAAVDIDTLIGKIN